MAASRKLQGEIDRCLKKVSEGVEQFEDIWKKVHNATNSNQKEKYEADLKKEIKKLQRLRDQIKSWLQSGEIKDKTQLLENRKLIETQMERFKVVERETKTKAYSKEGLGAAQNKDPAQREREETNRWLSESIDTLNIQVDQFESEIESLMAAGKKKKIDKEKSDRVDDLRDWLEKHRFHIKKLEILMRMLNNESIDCDQIKKIKEDVEYYIESSQDPDYVENDGVYDDIDMEDLDYPTPEITVGKQAVIGSHESTDGSTPSSSVCGSSPAPSPAATNNHSNDHVEGQPQAPSNFSSSSSSSHHERKRSNKSDDSRSGSTPVKPQVVRPSNTTSNSTSSNSLPNHSAIGNKATPSPSTPTKPVSGTTSQSTPNNSSSSSGLMNHLSFPSQLNNRESSHGNSSNSNINNTNSNSSSSSNSSNSISSNNNSSNSSSNNNSNSIIHNSINSHTISSLTTSSISSTNSHSNTNGPVSCGTSSNTSSSSGSNINSTITSNSTISHPATGGSGPTLNSSGSANAVTTSSISNQLLGSSGNSFDSGVSLKAMAQKKLNEVSSTSTLGHESSGANLASSISSNTSSITSVTGSINSVIANSQSTSSSLREKGSTSEAHIPPLLGVAPLGPVHLSSEHKLQYGRLQSAYFHMPHPSDSERFRLHFPRQPCQTPSYYPQVSSRAKVPPPMSDTVEFFQRLSTETLFFIFYYMEGTKAQYLAAKALKKQSWRFHTKHMMWFQRHEEPKAITDEFEQGTYVFFDYENWGQRKWENFIFEYRYLEDRDLN